MANGTWTTETLVKNSTTRSLEHLNTKAIPVLSLAFQQCTAPASFVGFGALASVEGASRRMCQCQRHQLASQIVLKLISGHRIEYSLFEKPLAKIWPLFNPFLLGTLDKYRAITAEDIAKAMVSSADLQKSSVSIYQWREKDALLHRPQR